MKDAYLYLIVCLMLPLVGCATTQQNWRTIGSLASLTDAQLAFHYHKVNQCLKPDQKDDVLKPFEQELLNRGLTPNELSFAKDGELAAGMSELALLAAKGRPLKRLITEDADKTSVRWIYTGRLTVLTEDGVITSIQYEK